MEGVGRDALPKTLSWLLTTVEVLMRKQDPVTYCPPAPSTQGSYMAVAMAVAVIMSWAVGLTGLDVPGEVTAAVATLIGWAAGKWGT